MKYILILVILVVVLTIRGCCGGNNINVTEDVFGKSEIEISHSIFFSYF